MIQTVKKKLLPLILLIFFIGCISKKEDTTKEIVYFTAKKSYLYGLQAGRTLSKNQTDLFIFNKMSEEWAKALTNEIFENINKKLGR